MKDQHEKIVQEINDSFTRNDVEAFLSHCHADVNWTMVGDSSHTGTDNIREWMKNMSGMEPPSFTVTEMISDDDSVVCYGDMTMSDPEHGGNYSYCDIYKFRDGKVAKISSFVIKQKS